MIDESVLEIFSNARTNVTSSCDKFVSVQLSCTPSPGVSSVEHVSLAPTFDYVAARLNLRHFPISIAMELSDFLCARVPTARIVSCGSFLCVVGSLKDLITAEQCLNTFVPKRSEEKLSETVNKGLASRYTYFCPKCPYRCSRKDALCRHRRLHSMGRRLHVCRVCSFSCFSRSALEQHSSRHSGYSVSCTMCHMSFCGRKSLANHVRLRHGTKSSQAHVCRCSACSYLTKSRKRFERHCCSHRQKMTVQKTYKCKLCFYVATSKSHVNRHVNEVHLRHRKIVCQVCGKAFARKENLSLHCERFHATTAANPSRHCCNLCGQTFRFKCRLSEHLLLHNPSSPYQCHICHRLLKSRRTLLKHLRNQHEYRTTDPLPTI
uniref:C2H2-type domain-containing protein n=1 Tax=Trichuris muris TaxID=70415 RepID=A0A5S6QHR0_TRIMR